MELDDDRERLMERYYERERFIERERQDIRRYIER